MYASWPRALPVEVELCAVQLPGREERFGEQPMTRWDDLVERVVEALMPWLDRPFVLFGHSLGAAVAFEVARRVRDHPSALVHLLVSGRSAPHLPLEDPPTYNLPTHEFLDELRRAGGTNDEVMRDPELIELFLPLLRADFQLSELYAYQDDAPLAVPISAFGGMTDERVSLTRLEGWSRHTVVAFERVLFPGGHFFIRDNREAMLLELARVVRHAVADLGCTRASRAVDGASLAPHADTSPTSTS